METPNPNSPTRTLRIEQLAEILGVHKSTIRRYQKLGMPHTPSVKNGPQGQTPVQYNAEECQAWVTAQDFATGTATDEQQSLSDKIKQQQFRKYKAQADTYTLQLQRAKEELIPRAEVTAANLTKISAVRNGLLGLASSLAPQLVGLTGAEIQSRIETEVMRLLESFSKG